MKLKKIEKKLSVCKLSDISKVDFLDDYCFLGKTDEEISLVCTTDSVPDNYVACENGWRAFRVEGTLDFSLIGIISKISKILADQQIGIFVVSTYNTDYILVKEDNWDDAVKALTNQEYTFV